MLTYFFDPLDPLIPCGNLAGRGLKMLTFTYLFDSRSSHPLWESHAHSLVDTTGLQKSSVKDKQLLMPVASFARSNLLAT